ncbi:hypothetical protein Sta7437_1216 [Stanieria cyanosphaera PCC 7437]|uniref:Mersacidin/lichenicidin family type 2 lantibiotic n=1 Tax=Stanieria cyanosphaera (strain ATCC 29371 / PCC 7437) TaxID=111780 RepID=K9XRV5_STAC7|nr:mersacidin/lichenicidin family type 2 lantibiotic [Stanieria cyanosphaera]AFZ34786.1 hypothetical protein Sta7437_1216 [Stanieria cyanosphaera PCC 7437]
MDIIRAWKDEDYYSNLNQEELRLLPENPAGIIELSDEQMEGVSGGGLQDNSFAACNINVNFNFNISVGEKATCNINSNNASVCISNIGGSC